MKKLILMLLFIAASCSKEEVLTPEEQVRLNFDNYISQVDAKELCYDQSGGEYEAIIYEDGKYYLIEGDMAGNYQETELQGRTDAYAQCAMIDMK